MNKRNLVIIGDSAFAEVAYECFTYDSEYEVVAFAVESDFLKQKELFGLPVLPLENIEDKLAPHEHCFYAALVYTQLNRLRTRMYQTMKAKGFTPASYISSRSFIWRNVQLGEHCFIFEDNTVQPFVEIGNNVVLWSGNHVGHHSKIMDNCFVASHAVISGFCELGESSFVGVNATLANNVTIGKDNWIGLGATIIRGTDDNALFKGQRSPQSDISAPEFFKVK